MLTAEDRIKAQSAADTKRFLYEIERLDKLLQDATNRALAAEAALAAERELMWRAAVRAREAREFDDHRVDIRIELDRGFFVITKDRGVIESHHTADAGGLLSLVQSRIAAIQAAETAALQSERDRLEAAAPLSARETARYLEIEHRLLELEAAAIRAEG